MELLSLERQRECLSPVLMEREISQAVDRGTLQALLRSGKVSNAALVLVDVRGSMVLPF